MNNSENKKQYKYELHCHTAEVSRCASTPAAEAVCLYKNMGYDGIVITDHYSPQTFMGRKAFCPQNYIDFYFSGYRAALKAAGNDFTVLLGMELRYYLTIDDFLVYGVTEEFLRNAGNLMACYHRRLFEKVDKSGLIVVEAHPFRALRVRAKKEYLHGSEILNCKDNKKINDKAEHWAEECGFGIRTAGTDFHDAKKTKAYSGIITHEKIGSNADLLRILRSGEYEIIKP